MTNPKESSMCEYTGPSGSQCEEPALEDGTYCFWHERNAPKTEPEVKEQLQDMARDQKSMEGFELTGVNLEDAYLMEADFSYANLSRVNLKDGHLFGINFKGAQLFKANLEHANLKEAVLEGADLLGAILDESDLERVEWGPKHRVRNHENAEHLEIHGDYEGAHAKFLESEDIYRSIRKRYEAVGLNDVAGFFFYWEMVVKRKQMSRFAPARLLSKFFDLLCGYGELPSRIILSSVTYIVLNALAFCLLGMNSGGEILTFNLDSSLYENIKTFGTSLYFSVVTFTTLGYGDIGPVGWARPFAALEAFGGVVMNTLFMLTFVKKMSR